MRTCLAAGLAGLLLTAPFAGAATFNGDDLATTPGISLPNGNGTNTGTSVQFSGTPTNQVMIDIDLDAFGIGLGGITSGTISFLTTRITSDSDFFFGLFDGTDFDNTGFWDGNRIGRYSGAGTSNGSTFVEGSFDAMTLLASEQSIGEQVLVSITFDLTAGTVSHDVDGTLFNRAIFPEIDLDGPLSFLIGKGTGSETLQIDSLSVPGSTTDVPLPMSALLLASALGILGAARSRQARTAG